MNKLFKPRCLRRIFLCLALIFPIVYLCGGLFFGLAGAHGEQMFAEPVYTEEYVEVNNTNPYGNYRLDIDDVNFPTLLDSSSIVPLNFKCLGRDYQALSIPADNTSLRFLYYVDVPNNFVSVINSTGVVSPFTLPISLYFVGDVPSILLNQYSTLYELKNIPTEYVPENNSAYTDFIFSQPFAKDNFITTLGKDLVNGSTKGFNPMNELFRSINSNIMNFDDSDNLAMFGLGYVYYSVNVLIVYEILILAVKLIMLPLKAVDLFDKEDKI